MKDAGSVVICQPRSILRKKLQCRDMKEEGKKGHCGKEKGVIAPAHQIPGRQQRGCVGTKDLVGWDSD